MLRWRGIYFIIVLDHLFIYSDGSDTDSEGDGVDLQLDYESLLATANRLFGVEKLQVVEEDSDDEGDSAHTPSDPEEEETIEGLFDQMDKELQSTSLADDFERDDKDAPVNLDLNLLKNALASFEAQEGLAGPISNMLGSLGVSLPRLNDKHKK